MNSLESPSTMQLSRSTDWLGRFVGNHTDLWIKLGNLESKLLAVDMDPAPIHAPVYICGLARAGSTILLEALAGHSHATTHRYEDFPFLFTPYWWRLLTLLPRRNEVRERAHGDGIMVSGKSPEAMEEMLWMAFFQDLHHPHISAVLDERTANPAFETFYAAHIRKLLRASEGQRYVSKGNYNI